MNDAWKFKNPGQNVVGNSAIQSFPDLIRRLGAKRVVVVTDPGIVRGCRERSR